MKGQPGPDLGLDDSESMREGLRRLQRLTHRAYALARTGLAEQAPPETWRPTVDRLCRPVARLADQWLRQNRADLTPRPPLPEYPSDFRMVAAFPDWAACVLRAADNPAGQSETAAVARLVTTDFLEWCRVLTGGDAVSARVLHGLILIELVQRGHLEAARQARTSNRRERRALARRGESDEE